MRLKVGGKIYGYCINKKGITTLQIKTDRLLQQDLDMIAKSKSPPEVNLDISIEE